MNVIIANDHAGKDLKMNIIRKYSQKFNFTNLGTDTTESVDYPLLAKELSKRIHNYDFGILICGTGNGVSMTANKDNNVRCALCWNKEIASLAKKHNNANIISLPARFLAKEQAFEIIDEYINSEFEGGRHQRRIDLISDDNDISRESKKNKINNFFLKVKLFLYKL